MSSISTKPKPEDVTNKPKVTVATVKPNIHRIKPDQENDEQLTPADDAVSKKRRLSPAMLKRSLTKVKEIDSEDDHPNASGADEDDPKREKGVPKKKEGADEDDPKREKVASKKKGADEDDPKREKVALKKKEGADKVDPKREKIVPKKKDADREDPEGESDRLKKLEDPNEEKSRKSKVKSKKTEDSDEEESKGSKVQSKKTEDNVDIDGEIVPYEAHGEILHRGKKKKSPPASVSDHESEEHHNHQQRRGGWVIRKDDEFFHFIVACFAIGAVLICEHSYGDWTVSAGFGLLVFASLETIGIYFGFVSRIRAVLEGFLPLFQRSAIPGLSNKK